ncbi:MAG TPA: hypothetical protein VF450_24270 [Noviherbaspirillum sp.]
MSRAYTLLLRSGIKQELRETRRGWEIWVMLLLAVALGVMSSLDFHRTPPPATASANLLEGSRLTFAGGIGWAMLMIVLIAQGQRTARRERDDQVLPMSSAWPILPGQREFASMFALLTICITALLVFLGGYQVPAAAANMSPLSWNDMLLLVWLVWVPGLVPLLVLMFTVQRLTRSASHSLGLIAFLVGIQSVLHSLFPSASAASMMLDLWGCANLIDLKVKENIWPLWVASRMLWLGVGIGAAWLSTRIGGALRRGREHATSNSKATAKRAPTWFERLLPSPFRRQWSGLFALISMNWHALAGWRAILWLLGALTAWTSYAIWHTASDAATDGMTLDPVQLLDRVLIPLRLPLIFGVAFWVGDWLWVSQERKERVLTDALPLTAGTRVLAAYLSALGAIAIVIAAQIGIAELGAAAQAANLLSLEQAGIAFILEVARLSLIAALTLALQLAAGQRASGWILTAVALCMVWSFQKFSVYGSDLFSMPSLADSSTLIDTWQANLAGLCRVAWAFGLQPVLLVLGAYFWVPADSYLKKRLWPNGAASALAVLCAAAVATYAGTHILSVARVRDTEQSWKGLAAHSNAPDRQLQIKRIDALIDLRNTQDAMSVQLHYTLSNHGDVPITEATLNLPPPWHWIGGEEPARERVRRITLDHPLLPGTTEVIALQIQKPAMDMASYRHGLRDMVRLASMPRIGLPYASSVEEGGDSSVLLPDNVGLLDQSVTLITPPEGMAFAPGRLASLDKTATQWRWKFEQADMPYHDALYGWGRYERIERSAGDVSIEVLHGPGQAKTAERAAQVAAWTLQTAGQRWGSYPRRELRVVAVPGLPAAVAFDGLILLPEFLLERDEPFNQWNLDDWVIAHEVAHQWWGMRWQNNNSRSETLLTESLAQATVDLVLREHGAAADLSAFRATECKQLAELKTQLQRAPENYGLRLERAYREGHDQMMRLRRAYGDEVVDKRLQSLLSQGPSIADHDVSLPGAIGLAVQPSQSDLCGK